VPNERPSTRCKQRQKMCGLGSHVIWRQKSRLRIEEARIDAVESTLLSAGCRSNLARGMLATCTRQSDKLERAMYICGERHKLRWGGTREASPQAIPATGRQRLASPLSRGSLRRRHIRHSRCAWWSVLRRQAIDILARLIAQSLAEQLSQQFIVENSRARAAT